MSIKNQLQAAIAQQSLPPPSETLLVSLTTARNPPPPLPSLIATARARLLACDLSSPSASEILNSSALGSLPSPPGPSSSSSSAAATSNGGDAYLATPELRLQKDVYLQILDIENLSLSRWEQIEQIEAVERGETTRGREVIRVTADDDDDQQQDGDATTQATSQQRQRGGNAGGGRTATTPNAGKNATHRLIVQDRSGRRLHALELRRIDGLGVGKTSIGEKILLRAGAVIARGTILLTPDNCVMLGGKIDAWHKAWVDGRLARLKEAAGVQ